MEDISSLWTNWPRYDKTGWIQTRNKLNQMLRPYVNWRFCENATPEQEEQALNTLLEIYEYAKSVPIDDVSISIGLGTGYDGYIINMLFIFLPLLNKKYCLACHELHTQFMGYTLPLTQKQVRDAIIIMLEPLEKIAKEKEKE